MPLMRRGPGLIGTAARAGVAVGVAGRVQRRQAERFADRDAGGELYDYDRVPHEVVVAAREWAQANA